LTERVRGNPSPRCADGLLRVDPPDRVQTFRVVGVEASAIEFPPYEGNLSAPVHLTPAFADRYARDLAGAELLFLRLRDGVDGDAFFDRVAAVNPDSPLNVVSVGGDHAATVERSIHLQAVGLGALAALVGFAVAYALGQAFGRQTFLADERDLGSLRALGMTDRQLVGMSLVRSGVTALVGVVLAITCAIAVSPLLPIGLARDAEPEPGIAIDVTVLLFGALAIVLLATTVSAATTARAIARQRRTAAPARVTLVARFAQRLRLPVSAAIGVRNALEPGRGRTAVPVRGAMIATMLAVSVSVASVTLASSIDHLLETPQLFGWSRDAQIGNQGNPPIGQAIADGLEQRREIRSVAVGTITDVGVGTRTVSTFALDDEEGESPIDLLEGRRPRADDEIVLGIETMDQLDLRVGDRVPVVLAGTRVEMTVVGRAVFSTIGNNGQLGRGAQITWSALEHVLPTAPKNVVHVEFAAGTDREALRDDLQEAVAPLTVFGPAPPTELTNFGRVENLPALLAVAMGVLATIVLAHTLLAGVHRRRRDYATLNALGFRNRQTVRAVTIQATTFAVVSLTIGLPLGILIGTRMWSVIADELGVPSVPVAAAATVAVVAVTTLAIANVVAIVPAWVACRTRASTELRTG
jgi:ABC-type lipoprotein release transport system permease subunit